MRFLSSLRLAGMICALALVSMPGCTPKPPANWAVGGEHVAIAQARWQRGETAIELLPDGRVTIDGDHSFSVDGAGRVFEPSGEPIALLEPDGKLIGTDDHWLGQIGVRTAGLPRSAYAWLSIGPGGEVTRFDDEGERHPDGIWSQACLGAASQTCMLVTHVITLREEMRRPRVGFGIGIGMGFHR